MKLQVAFDRMDIQEMMSILDQIHKEIDIIEIGTSLIVQYGVDVIEKTRMKYPDNIILADTKIFDNTAYELNLCFEAGADIVSILGCATENSIDIAIDIVNGTNKAILIDMLNTSDSKKEALMMKSNDNVIYCFHHGKDDQLMGKKADKDYQIVKDDVKRNYALAGGVDPKLVASLKDSNINIVIVGSYITKAKDVLASVIELKEAFK